MIRECRICGKLFNANVSNRKTCSQECADIRRRQYIDEQNARARAATRERLGTKICAICGKEFAPNHPAKMCCSPECQRERDRDLVRSKRKYKGTKQKNKSSEEQIIDINAKAKAMGLSYGQYVARYGG
jgi:hypothetical protein